MLEISIQQAVMPDPERASIFPLFQKCSSGNFSANIRYSEKIPVNH